MEYHKFTYNTNHYQITHNLGQERKKAREREEATRQQWYMHIKEKEKDSSNALPLQYSANPSN